MTRYRVGAQPRSRSSIPAKKVIGRTFLDGNVYDHAKQRTRKAIALHDDFSVNFSGGKDSMTLLEIVIEVARELDRLPVTVDFVDEEAINPETEAYCRRTAARPEVNFRWWAFPIKCNAACSTRQSVWYPWAPEDEHLWVRPYPHDVATPTPDWIPTRVPAARLAMQEVLSSMAAQRRGGTSCVFVALRSSESPTRLNALSNGRADFWMSPGPLPGSTIAKPIYDWNEQDVWTGVRLFGWDYNASYDLMWQHGVSAKMARVGVPFGGESIQELDTTPILYPPDYWARLCLRVPGAATALLYGNTELYAKGSAPPKPDGLTYTQWVETLLNDLPPIARSREASHVRAAIRRHYKATDLPIVPEAPHPDSGVSWHGILNFVLRGDALNRQYLKFGSLRSRAKNNPDVHAKMLTRYLAELDTWRDRTHELR